MNTARKEGVRVTIHVTNGYQVKNVRIQSYDSYVVIVEGEDGAQMMIYKSAISTITPQRPLDFRVKKEESADGGSAS